MLVGIHHKEILYCCLFISALIGGATFRVLYATDETIIVIGHSSLSVFIAHPLSCLAIVGGAGGGPVAGCLPVSWKLSQRSLQCERGMQVSWPSEWWL